MVFLYGHWTRLGLNTRNALAREFGIPKTGTTHVIDNRVAQDGYKVEDIESAINVDAIQRYTGSDSTDLDQLWARMVDKVEGREYTTSEEFKIPVMVEVDASSFKTVVGSIGDADDKPKKTPKKKKVTKKTKTRA